MHLVERRDPPIPDARRRPGPSPLPASLGRDGRAASSQPVGALFSDVEGQFFDGAHPPGRRFPLYFRGLGDLYTLSFRNLPSVGYSTRIEVRGPLRGRRFTPLRARMWRLARFPSGGRQILHTAPLGRTARLRRRTPRAHNRPRIGCPGAWKPRRQPGQGGEVSHAAVAESSDDRGRPGGFPAW